MIINTAAQTWLGHDPPWAWNRLLRDIRGMACKHYSLQATISLGRHSAENSSSGSHRAYWTRRLSASEPPCTCVNIYENFQTYRASLQCSRSVELPPWSFHWPCKNKRKHGEGTAIRESSHGSMQRYLGNAGFWICERLLSENGELSCWWRWICLTDKSVHLCDIFLVDPMAGT